MLLALKITQFRNLSYLHLNPHRFNFIIGQNGSGKTSILEAIYYLTHGRSFRTHKLNKLIQQGNTSTVVFAELDGSQTQKLGAQRLPGKTQIKLNGNIVRNSSELAYLFPVKIINQDIHDLIQANPNIRRSFVDWGVFHVEPQYAEIWKQYRSSLSQRNAALRNRASSREIQVWDRPLAEAGEMINEYRRSYLASFEKVVVKRIQLRKEFKEFYWKWHSGWEGGGLLIEALDATLAKDRERGFTQVGPHKAELTFYLGDELLRDKVSRGQQKWIAMELTLSQLELLAERKLAACVLVDDLASEFDSDFESNILDRLRQLQFQTFVTLIEKDFREAWIQDSDQLFHVEHGSILEKHHLA